MVVQQAPSVPPPNPFQPTSTKQQNQNSPSYLTGVSKFAPGQTFTYSSIEGKYIPVGKYNAGVGTLTYSQLPPSATIQLEKEGVISAEKAPPSGAGYQYVPGIQTQKGQNVFQVTPTSQIAAVGKSISSVSPAAAPQVQFAPSPGMIGTSSPQGSAVKISLGPTVISPDIASVRVTQGSRGGVDFLRFEPITSSGDVYGSGIGPGGLKKITPGYEQALPNKEKVIQSAIDVGYEEFKATPMPAGYAMTKAEFAAFQRPDLESQYAGKINAIASSPEVRGQALGSLRLQAVQSEQQLKILSSPEYKAQELTAELARPGGEASQIFKAGGFPTSYSSAGLTESEATLQIAKRLATERTYPQKSGLEQTLTGGAYGLSFGLVPRPEPTTNAAITQSLESPAGRFSVQGLQTAELAGGLTVAGPLAVGAARTVGITGPLAIGAIKAAPTAAGLALGGLGALSFIESRSQIEQLKASGAPAAETGFLEKGLYAGLAGSIVGGIAGAGLAGNYLSERPGTSPIRFVKRAPPVENIERPSGEFIAKGFALETLPSPTRAQIIAKDIPTIVTGSAIKSGRVIESTGDKGLALRVSDSNVETATALKGGTRYGSQFLRKGDVETSQIISQKEYTPGKDMSGFTEPTFVTGILRSGTKGISAERVITNRISTEFPEELRSYGPTEAGKPIRIETFRMVQRGGVGITEEGSSYIYTNIPTRFTKVSFIEKQAPVEPISSDFDFLVRNPEYGKPGEALFILSDKGGVATESLPKGGKLKGSFGFSKPRQITKIRETESPLAADTSTFSPEQVSEARVSQISELATAAAVRDFAKFALKSPSYGKPSLLIGKTSSPSLKINLIQPASLKTSGFQVSALQTSQLTTPIQETPLKPISFAPPALALRTGTSQIQTQSLRLETQTQSELRTTGGLITSSLFIPPATGESPFGLPSPRGESPSGRREGGGFRLGRGKPSKRKKAGETTGILSEGISKALFGKASLGPRPRGGRAISSPTKELQVKGLTVAKFLTGGGFVAKPAKFKLRL